MDGADVNGYCHRCGASWLACWCLLRKGAAILAVLALAGCGELTGPQKAEVVWQALNVIDAGQTATVARNPDRWREGNPVTRALIGEHPTEGKVYAGMAAFALVHYGVTRWLDYEDTEGQGGWHVALIAWQSITIGEKGFTVGRNASMGVRPWGGR